MEINAFPMSVKAVFFSINAVPVGGVGRAIRFSQKKKNIRDSSETDKKKNKEEARP